MLPPQISFLAAACGFCLTLVAIQDLVAQSQPGKAGQKSFDLDTAPGTSVGKRRGAIDKNQPPATIILLELTTGDEGVGIRAQRWHQIFDKLDVALTIRRGTSSDKYGLTEKRFGKGARQVHILGKLDPQGRIVVEERLFTENDVARLTRWLDELREFGAQGTPDGQPAWGLTKDQFGAVHAALSKPLAAEPKDQEFADALKLFQLPPDLPIRLSESAAKILKNKDSSKVGQSLGGVAQGTALAALVSEHGLGFQPRRLRDGAIVLSVEPLSELREPWPVGWPLSQMGPKVAPKLFAFTQIDLQEIELDAVLEAAVDFIDMPILVDRGGLAAKQIDFSMIKVSHPAKRTTWGLALGTLLSQARTKFELLADEAGRPFLWVTPSAVPRRTQNN